MAPETDELVHEWTVKAFDVDSTIFGVFLMKHNNSFPTKEVNFFSRFQHKTWQSFQISRRRSEKRSIKSVDCLRMNCQRLPISLLVTEHRKCKLSNLMLSLLNKDGCKPKCEMPKLCSSIQSM